MAFVGSLATRSTMPILSLRMRVLEQGWRRDEAGTGIPEGRSNLAAWQGLRAVPRTGAASVLTSIGLRDDRKPLRHKGMTRHDDQDRAGQSARPGDQPLPAPA